jgi:RNA polymerase sigma factor (sigma-70 family)
MNACTEATDESLVLGAKAGDATSMALLLERHRPMLYARALRLVGHAAECDDLVQDTFLVALSRVGDVRDHARPGAWLAAILTNLFRARRRRAAVATRAAAEQTPPRLEGSPVEEAIERASLRDWVWSAIAELWEPQRLVVVLRYFTDARSYAAIAAACGVPVGTVRSRLSAARTKLADELLRTASREHIEIEMHQRVAAAAAEALTTFARTGNRQNLESAFASDLRFTLKGMPEDQGLELFATRLAEDFEDGVRGRVTRVFSGPRLAILQAALENPSDDPYHCPPAVTQVLLHDGGLITGIVSHYEPRLLSAQA